MYVKFLDFFSKNPGKLKNFSSRRVNHLWICPCQVTKTPIRIVGWSDSFIDHKLIKSIPFEISLQEAIKQSLKLHLKNSQKNHFSRFQANRFPSYWFSIYDENFSKNSFFFFSLFTALEKLSLLFIFSLFKKTCYKLLKVIQHLLDTLIEKLNSLLLQLCIRNSTWCWWWWTQPISLLQSSFRSVEKKLKNWEKIRLFV